LNPADVAETAIVLPVLEAEPAVGAVRRLHTVEGADGMPAHITLLYPFTDSEQLESSQLDRIGKALAAFAPFEAELTRTDRFERPADTVVWLAPDPVEPFAAMADALAAEFPEHAPYGGKYESIVPHLTVAMSAAQNLLDAIEADVAGRLPIRIRVYEAALYEHTPDGWKVRTPLPL
jgi:2'-5' RNA ligase